eukprot:Clim_evm34s191 gene=Clim_evmTU34s191
MAWRFKAALPTLRQYPEIQGHIKALVHEGKLVLERKLARREALLRSQAALIQNRMGDTDGKREAVVAEDPPAKRQAVENTETGQPYPEDPNVPAWRKKKSHEHAAGPWAEGEKAAPEKAFDEEGNRFPKMKIGFIMAYNGSAYSGMQRNPNVPSIENELFSAMLAAGVINKEQYRDPFQLKWNRSARTDKGVSAAGQICSMRLRWDDSFIEQINGKLPEQIRIFGARKVTKGFRARQWCDSRQYQYIMPTYALKCWRGQAIQEIALDELRGFRVSKENLDIMRDALRKFQGVHNFHNYTSRLAGTDPSVRRYIHRFDISEPFVRNELEFVVFTVKGQSFMLHHIRKMLGTALMVTHGICKANQLPRTFDKHTKFALPRVPGLGLILDKVFFEKYNKKFGAKDGRMNLEFGDVDDKLEAFKAKYIWAPIIKAETEDFPFRDWLRCLHIHQLEGWPANQQRPAHLEVAPDEEPEKKNKAGSGSNGKDDGDEEEVMDGDDDGAPDDPEPEGVDK